MGQRIVWKLSGASVVATRGDEYSEAVQGDGEGSDLSLVVFKLSSYIFKQNCFLNEIFICNLYA